MSNTPCFVFVYGTLKRGKWNNRVLQDSEFFDVAVSSNNYVMTDVGYPYLWHEKLSGLKDSFYPKHMEKSVSGEIYLVKSQGVLGNLDALENHPTHYLRVSQSFIALSKSSEVEAWVYIAQAREGYLKGPIVVSGTKKRWIWNGERK